MANHEHRHEQKPPRHGLPTRWVLIGFLIIAGYFLLTEHRAHFIQYLPFALLLACQLLHFFHGHGGHGDAGEKPGRGEQRESERSRDTAER